MADLVDGVNVLETVERVSVRDVETVEVWFVDGDGDKESDAVDAVTDRVRVDLLKVYEIESVGDCTTDGDGDEELLALQDVMEYDWLSDCDCVTVRMNVCVQVGDKVTDHRSDGTCVYVSVGVRVAL